MKKSPAQLDYEIAEALWQPVDPGFEAGFKTGEEQARHDAAPRETLRQLRTHARTDFERGLVAGYESICSGKAAESKRSHATMKTDGGSRAPATKRALPGLSKWDMTAGGGTAAPGKHGYGLSVPEGRYYISPYTTSSGRHAGYHLQFAATGGRPRGAHGGLWHDLGEHRSPASAASAAAKHYAQGVE